jgi:hypothetical protein
MTLLRAHQTAALAIALAVAAFGAALAFARPGYHHSVMSSRPNDLPYSFVSYSRADAVVAFAAVGVRLTPRSKSAVITTLGSRGDALEVDVFGDPQRVKAAGFHDYLPLNGRYVHFPRTCGTALPDAERWKGNVRVIIQCTAATGGSAAWLRRTEQALARLGT